MATRGEAGERIASLETQVKYLEQFLASQQAELKETTREFRQALDTHRDKHKDEGKESADRRWKFATFALGVAVIVGPIVTYYFDRVL